MTEGKGRSIGTMVTDRARILVVAAHRGTGEALTRALEFFGYDVRLASGAAEALELLRQPEENRIDLLVCDAGPPLEITAAAEGLLIRLQAERGTRGIAFGGYDERGLERDEILAAGFEDYLIIPFTIDRLVGAVQRGIARGPAPVGGKN